MKILLIDDEKQYRMIISKILSKHGYDVTCVATGKEGIELLNKNQFDLIISDLVMKGLDGIEILESVKKEYPTLEVIIITGYGSVKNAVDAMKKGAFSYFIKSNNFDELLLEIKKVEKLNSLTKENNLLKLEKKDSKYMLKTMSPKMQHVLDIAKKAALSDANILLTGESGVGKEVFSHYIHMNSNRSHKTMVPVNCHTYSDSLLESELFGHKKGAFTGASEDRIGKFEMADEGTMFLDEIGEISLDTQVKLLRVLEAKQIEKVGSNQLVDIDFRLVCATNRDLRGAINEGAFREDLFYRISTITIEIPPLRERKEDLDLLIDYFINKFCLEMKREVSKVEPEVMNFLLSYDYPGNIRELKNIVERLVVLSENGVITYRSIPSYIEKTGSESIDLKNMTLKEYRDQMEKAFIKKVLTYYKGNVTQTAKSLDISRRQMYNIMNKYGL